MTTETTTNPQHAKLTLGIDGMVSPRSEQIIEGHLAKLPGVAASANFPSRSLQLEFDRTRCAMPEIARRLDEIGMRIRPGGALKPDPSRDRYRADPMARLAKFFAENPQMATAV